MKLAQLRKDFAKLGIDGCLLTAQDPNFYYFLQEKVNDGGIIITKTGKPYLLLTPLEDLQSNRFKTLQVRDFYETLGEIIKKHNIRVLGINENALYAKSYKRIRKKVHRTKTVFNYLNKLRSTKTEEEVRIIRKGCKKTCDIMNQLITELKKKRFRRESDVKNWLKIRTLQGGDELAFEPIVASGKDAAIPHYFRDKPLAKGFLIVDYGIRHKGYCTDMTRTFYLGKPTAQELRLYEKVLECQEKTISYIASKYKKNVSGLQAYEHANKVLGPLQKYFIHGLGHGIGVKVHELPTLSERPKEKLAKGTVFTVEPGYYNKLGIRIEDDIYLGEELELLTRHVPKALITIR